MTNVKRPICLQIGSLHGNRGNSGRLNGALDELDSSSQSSSHHDHDLLGQERQSIVRRRSNKTQSMVLPSSATPPVSSRASIPARFRENVVDGEQLRYYDSNNAQEDCSSSTKSSSTNRAYFSESCSDSSTSSSSSSTSTDSQAPSLILPYLYVGDQAQTQLDTISNLNISYILSLQSLPKFLSNSPQSTPPLTPTIGVSSRIGSFTSKTNSTTSNQSDSNDYDIDAATNEREEIIADRRKAQKTNCGQYDIIDGGDGGLLPSINSSKDYLVKIKSLNHVDDYDDGEDVDEDEKNCNVDNLGEQTVHQQGLSSPQFECGDQPRPSVDRDHSMNIATTCDTTVIDSSKTTTESNTSDDELNGVPMDSTDLPNNCKHVSNSEASCSSSSTASTRSGALLGCKLTQRCNRISSSVHRIIRGKCINISDTFEQLLDKFFDETHNFIDEARRNKCNILIHCKAGISRSPTIAIAYLMKWKRLHLQDAYNFVKRCRPQISPNLNFMGQLVSYERRSQLSSPISCCLPSPKVSQLMIHDTSLEQNKRKRTMVEREDTAHVASSSTSSTSQENIQTS